MDTLISPILFGLLGMGALLIALNALSKGGIFRMGRPIKTAYRNKQAFSFWLSITVLVMVGLFGITALFSLGPLKGYSLAGVGSDVVLFFQK